MHILILPSWYSDNENPISGTFFREQAQSLSQAGHMVGIIAPFLTVRKNKKINIKIHKRFIERIEFENDGKVGTYRGYSSRLGVDIPWGNLYIWTRLAIHLFREYRSRFGTPDVVHLHSVVRGGMTAVYLKKRYKLPFVVTEHSSDFLLGRIKPWYEILARLAFEEASAIAVVSPSLGKVLEEKFGDSVRPWTWVPNMVEPLFVHNPEIMSKGFRFLNVGFLSEKKGQRDLIKAFASSFKDDREVELRIGGDGPIRNSLIREANDLGVGDRVRFLGNLTRSQVKDEMQACHSFVLSSHVETFGIVIVEAMACGKPVISTICGGPQFIVNENNGILVPPKAPQQLSDAMMKIKDNIKCYDSKLIRNECLARFSSEVLVKNLEALYEKAICQD
jgi:glycosyltransferase involved in cell wall biosynthesis